MSGKCLNHLATASFQEKEKEGEIEREIYYHVRDIHTDFQIIRLQKLCVVIIHHYVHAFTIVTHTTFVSFLCINIIRQVEAGR